MHNKMKIYEVTDFLFCLNYPTLSYYNMVNKLRQQNC